jgi:RHS repeat-associated protein
MTMRTAAITKDIRMADQRNEAQGPPSPFAVPQVNLPKGGGAIRGIGEKFAANPVTGTISMSVPIHASSGRSGFGPELALSYDVGSGNGPFGFGWTLGLPSITRETDKGLPQYADAIDSDVFLLSGAEDLVPVTREHPDGSWSAHEEVVGGFRIRRYQPRIEGLFARIERWSSLAASGDVHWRAISSDNVLTLYGLDAESRIADPENPSRIFSWLICETRDDNGNAVLYRYKADNGTGVDLAQAHERNRGPRTDVRRGANRYIKRILYGNRVPLLDHAGARPRFLDRMEIQSQIANGGWMFQLVFDYGDHDSVAPTPADDTSTDGGGKLAYPWPSRPDPFSSYRSTFEVRTLRRCRRALMFHHFPGTESLGLGLNCLVRSTDFNYSSDVDPADVRNPVYSFLTQVTQSAYRRSAAGYDKRSMPPIDLDYTTPVVQSTVEEVDPASLENLPGGLAGGAYRWADLHGEGLPGMLTEQGGAWFYKRNLSPIPKRRADGSEVIVARFAPREVVPMQPNVSLASGAELLDLAGDGRPDIVIMQGRVTGLYEHDAGDGWQPFRPFTSFPTRDLRDPNLRFVDLDGDGRADLLITEDHAFVWYPSIGEEGFSEAHRVAQALDEEEGPRVVLADGTQSIYLADLSGDGLADIVRIRNGEVSYWPNLGHARFGAKITMDNAPWFDHPDQFDPERIRLADIDGSGTTDIIYLHRDGIHLYFNQSGNAWSNETGLPAFPSTDNAANVVATDLLGNGTACLVWSSPLAANTGSPMRYVNLMGGSKPHLLVKVVNNLGAETRVDYSPSTKFYLQDRQRGRPWITRLPFPVHVVERVEKYDHVSRHRFVTRYAYHDGYFDGEEREFRGFGMVEQWDTEQFETLGGAANVSAESHVPAVHMKTWFHTGVALGRDQVSDYYAGLGSAVDPGEYFREPGLTDAEARALLLPDTELPDGLTVDDEREACRALKGSMLRQEVYADDAGPGATAEEIRRAATPYTVTEQTFAVRVVQRRGSNRHAVFLTHAAEAITYSYDRNPADPRVQHRLTLEVDAFGNVLKEAVVGYGRRTEIRVIGGHGHVRQVPNPALAALLAADRAKQITPLVTYTEHRVTNAVVSADAHRNPSGCEVVTFELTGYAATAPAGRFQAADLVEPDPASSDRLRHKFATEAAYEATPPPGSCRRRIEWVRTLFRRDDLTGLLPLGQQQSMGIPGEQYKLAMTPGLLTEVFQRPRPGNQAESLISTPATVLEARDGSGGGYVSSQTLKDDGRFPATDPNDHWWASSGRSYFTPDSSDTSAIELAEARRHFFQFRRYRDPFDQDACVDLDGDDLLPVETRDALGNRVTVVNDYRVLQPRLSIDANQNRQEVAFDILGLVAGTAQMGKALPAAVEGDTLLGFSADLSQVELDDFFAATDPHVPAPALLQNATTRVVYDVNRFQRTQRAHPNDPTQWRPPCAATLERETHVSAALPPQGLKIRIAFAYADGFGREIQKKVQAESGPLVTGGPMITPRWTASGWTIFNNKGKPVHQYEPFFSGTHDFEFGAISGVSSILFYDPVDRVVATLHPNHSYEKVVFDSWQSTTYDVNDTCAPRGAQTGDPRTDPDIRGYVARYFANLPAGPTDPLWQTWYAQRAGGALGPREQAAAERAAAHSDTPTTVHHDALGRAVLTMTRNRVVCPGHDLDGTEETLPTRVDLDIRGNRRVMHDGIQQAADSLGRIVSRFAYDLLGNLLHEINMEAGARWILTDAVGRVIRVWDSRGHNVMTIYDALRRPLEQYVRGTTGDSDPRTLDRDVLVERRQYGESVAGSEALNLRTRAFRHDDAAGTTWNARLDASSTPIEAYDFKGNLLGGTRRFLTDYKALPDWRHGPALEDEAFESATRYDALNRPIQLMAPHSNLPRATRHIMQPSFNEANLLERVDVWLARSGEPAGLIDRDVDTPSPVGIASVDYDAKAQRLRVDYKNGVTTRHRYDPHTFRLTHLDTRGAPPDNDGLQELQYTYDPAGNILEVSDAAQQTIYFRNQQIEAGGAYVYDALYRLIQATGREHLGQQDGGARHAPIAADAFNTVPLRQTHPNVLQAMGTYTERYVYDGAGNLVEMQHRGSDPEHPGWTRGYTYAETSLTENGTGGSSVKVNNRLTSTKVNPNRDDLPPQETYLHDPHGNITRLPHLGLEAGPNLVWSYRDELRECDLGGGGTAFYTYDGSGQRVRKVWEKTPGLIEERLYLNGFEIFRSHNGRLAPDAVTLERETLHVMVGSERIALVEMRTIDTAGTDPAPAQFVRYQHGTYLGSVSLELDDRGEIISFEEYAPYGSTTYQAVRSQTATPKRYHYTAKERDEESGLYYYGARFYAPWLGRWTQCDRVEKRNRYEYVSDSPIRYFDPDGNDESEGANRFWGGLRMLGGAGQLALGTLALLAPEPTMVTKVVGTIAVVNGSDDFMTGARQLISGRQERGAIETTVTVTAEAAGMNQDNAEALGTGTSMALGFVSPTGPMTNGPRAVPALARATTGEVVLITATADMTRVADHARGAQLAANGVRAGHTMLMSTNEEGGETSSSSESSASSSSSQSSPEPNSTQIPPEYFDEAMTRIDEGELQASGAHLQDLTNHAQSSAARAERGIAAQSGQSAHVSARSAMRNVPGYDPRAALTRLLDSTPHRGFDDNWKRVFRQMANASGDTEIAVGDYFNVMRDAIGNNPHFSNAEANSMVELLRDELFVQHGLSETDMLRLPYSK